MQEKHMSMPYSGCGAKVKSARFLNVGIVLFCKKKVYQDDLYSKWAKLAVFLLILSEQLQYKILFKKIAHGAKTADQ
jgi:hypothetical protein